MASGGKSRNMGLPQHLQFKTSGPPVGYGKQSPEFEVNGQYATKQQKTIYMIPKQAPSKNTTKSKFEEEWK